MMRRFVAVLLALAPLASAADPISLSSALEKKQVTVEFSGNGRDTIHLQASALEKIKVTVPAGARFIGENGETQITLRSLEIEPGPGSGVDAILPAAALKSTNTPSLRTLTPNPAGEPKLTKLLELFGSQNDLPRPTAQLAIFVSLEDLSWTNWKKWMEPVWTVEKPPKAHPTAAEVAQAVDAIAFAKLAEPDRKFAILADDDFKRLALRNPWARGKAMALYGLSVEDAITGDSSLPVDLGKLLHTSPNDNCPICRQRAKGPADIP